MNKYRSGTQMHLMDEKCHDDYGDDDEDNDVSNNNDDDELMMMMVMMIYNKDKLRSDN